MILPVSFKMQIKHPIAVDALHACFVGSAVSVVTYLKLGSNVTDAVWVSCQLTGCLLC